MAKEIGASDLFYSVALEKRAEADDGYGNTVSNWVVQFQCRAAFHHLRGGESVMAGRLGGKHTQIITLRRSARTLEVATDWRVRDARNGDVFNIRDVTQETDRRWISLLVEKGVAT
jgi:SPP1 family predicted phage head-tail adaptor